MTMFSWVEVDDSVTGVAIPHFLVSCTGCSRFSVFPEAPSSQPPGTVRSIQDVPNKLPDSAQLETCTKSSRQKSMPNPVLVECEINPSSI